MEPFVLLGCVLSCAAVGASSLASTEPGDPQSSAAAANRRAHRRLAATLCVIAAFCCLSLACVGFGVSWPLIPLALFTVGAGVALHPWLLISRVLIPLGWSRAAFALGRSGGPPWLRDPMGGRVLGAALAKLRQPRHVPDSSRALERALQSEPIRGAGLVARGLLAADAGDPDRARRLLESLELLDPDVVPPRARTIALDWLVADDATRGRWESIVARCEDAPVLSPTTRLLEGCARRLLGERLASRRLLSLWIRAPRRTRTLSLLRRALSARTTALPFTDAADADPAALSANDAPTPPAALAALHMETARTALVGPVPHGAFARLNAAWQHALEDPQVHAWIRNRVLSLSSSASVSGALLSLYREASADMADMLAQTDAPLGPTVGGALRRALRTHIDTHVTEIDRTARQLRKRLASSRSSRISPISRISALEVWDACTQLRKSYQVLLRTTGTAASRHVFGIVDAVSSEAVVWLWNEQGERALANALSLWLQLEAERVGHREAAAFHSRNAAVAP